MRNQQLAQALRLVQTLHRDRPTDTGVLRQLMDIYSVQRDWNSAQKLLRDFKHYGALPKQGAAAVEIEVYSGLFTDFVASSDLNKTEQYNQLAELWELVPKALRKTPELVAPFADALAQIEATDKLLPLLSKTLNNHWHPDLIERFGTLPIATRKNSWRWPRNGYPATVKMPTCCWLWAASAGVWNLWARPGTI